MSGMLEMTHEEWREYYKQQVGHYPTMLATLVMKRATGEAPPSLLHQRADGHLTFWRAIADNKVQDPTLTKKERKEWARVQRDAEMYVAGAEAILAMAKP